MIVVEGMPVGAIQQSPESVYPKGSGPIGCIGRTDAIGLPLRTRPAVIPCPYCRESLVEYFDAFFIRAKCIMPDGTVLVDLIPPDYAVLACRPCQQVFTLPRFKFEELR